MSKAECERSRFIHDGPEYFRTSVVLYTRFENRALRQMFAYLREKEAIFQKDLEAEKTSPKGRVIQCRLAEIETQLIWMVTNLR